MEMKKLSLFALFALLCLGLASCGGSSSSDSGSDKTVSVDRLMADAASMVGDTVTVEGVCSHLCKHGGRKAFLVGYDRSVPKLRQANHCIGCNKCRPHCPQGINIPRRMRDIDNFVEQLKQGTLA